MLKKIILKLIGIIMPRNKSVKNTKEMPFEEGVERSGDKILVMLVTLENQN